MINKLSSEGGGGGGGGGGGADPGFLKRGLICIKVLGLTLLILSIFS